MATEAAPEDVADAAVAAGMRFTMVPARIRRIDRALAQHGVNWSWPELAKLSPGRSSPRPVTSDWAYTSVQLMRSGGAGIDMATIGALARTMAPADGVAPIAGQIEYRWPISRGKEPEGTPEDEHLLALLGTGDLRDQARDLAMTVPSAELRDAFQMAAGLFGWADGICAGVEREIAYGQSGEAAREWITSAFGVSRLLLAIALREPNAGPSATAITALVLIMIRSMIRTVSQLIPAGNFDVLNNPLVAPAFLVDFLSR